METLDLSPMGLFTCRTHLSCGRSLQLLENVPSPCLPPTAPGGGHDPPSLSAHTAAWSCSQTRAQGCHGPAERSHHACTTVRPPLPGSTGPGPHDGLN